VPDRCTLVVMPFGEQIAVGQRLDDLLGFSRLA